jgi:preprotein translocase subunit YajC
LLPILLLVVFWFLLIVPQRKRDKEMRKRQAELKNGDQVITSAGIYGKIVNLDGNRVTLQVSENSRIVFQRQAIVGFSSDDKPNSK